MRVIIQTILALLMTGLAACDVGLLYPSAHEAKDGIPVYTDAAFDTAQKAGKPIFLDVWASWCPVCAAQDKVIGAKVLHNPKYAGAVILRVDFDRQKDVLKRFDVDQQSTLIAFKNGVEVGRVVGGTSEEVILGLTSKLLG